MPFPKDFPVAGDVQSLAKGNAPFFRDAGTFPGSHREPRPFAAVQRSYWYCFPSSSMISGVAVPQAGPGGLPGVFRENGEFLVEKVFTAKPASRIFSRLLLSSFWAISVRLLEFGDDIHEHLWSSVRSCPRASC